MNNQIYLSPDEGGASGGDTAETITIGGVEFDANETITIGGKEYTVSEIEELESSRDKLKGLDEREAELDRAASGLKPFLKALEEDPDQAEAEMQQLLDEARQRVSERGWVGDKAVLKRLEAQEGELAKMRLESTVKDMRSDSENFPHFKGHEEEVFRYCADNEIANLDVGYHSWVGRNLKKLNSEAERKVKSDDATALGRTPGHVRSVNDVYRLGESMYSYLKRTGNLPKE